ncbi:YhhN-like protein [Monaibacterium marinum]|uniref:YhhN-like protein n=1 Tax=Pontivivens marinum TaxID=1690039 RepID=A0A2C9CVW3_9RHOB|nr:lysoplasmalogenase family protein [Monaibacterium marinum]SOH95412.1 YhhN-like protein [Monaibacterium marinum]
MYEINAFTIAALVISLISSVIYVGYFQLRAVSVPRSVSKTMSILALAVAAWLGGVSELFCVGLLLCAVADCLKSLRSDRLFFVAVIASASMQLLTCIWFVFVLWVGIEAPLVGILGVFGVSGGFFAMVWPKLKGGNLLLIPYFFCTMLLFSLGLGASPGRPLLMLGLTFYLITLLLLGFEVILFNKKYRFLRVVGPIIWVFYHAGLTLMMIGGAE